MYHRIAEESFDPWGLAVTPAHFGEQLAWLSENRTVLRLEDFADLHRRRKLPADAIAVTFDDGYARTVDLAVPLLEQYRIAATIFLPFELIEERRAFWWDELEEIVLAHGSPTLELGGETIAIGDGEDEDRRWSPGSAAGTARQKAFHEILDRLVPMSPADLHRAMEELRAQATRLVQVPAGKLPVTPERARAMVGNYVDIGSHTLTHPSLPSLSPSEQRREICGSIERGEAMTGSAPKTFAYPFGNFDAQSERLAEEAGFACACATRNAAVSRKSRTSNLSRLQVRDWDAATLERELSRIHTA